MKKISNIGIISHHKEFNSNNGIFNPLNYQHGDDLVYPFTLLKETLNGKDIDINTLDMRPLKEFDVILFFNFPLPSVFPVKSSIKDLYESGKKLFMIINESGLRWPENGNISNHAYFEKIFTWNDSLADGNKYIKYSIPYKISKDVNINISKDRKLLVLIASNINERFPGELYSERINAIRWFERHLPDDFDLYGHGWESELFRRPSVSVFIKLLCLSKRLRKIFDNDYFSSYRGPIDSKHEILSKYKYSICYENVKDIPGYITEKIFDCFFAGCIPVYLGASNVTDYVPENTFIDKRKFSTYESLNKYIANMSKEEYEGYIDNIREYLMGDKIKVFSAENFVNVILQNILNEG